MKRIVSLIAILTLTAMTFAMSSASHDSGSGIAAGAAHSHMAEPSIVDILVNCCSTQDGKVHHTMSACAMDCGNAVHWLTVAFAVTDAGLKLSLLHRHNSGLSSIKFRPPIAV